MCPVSLLQILQVAVGEEVQHRSARRRHLSNGGPKCLYRMMPEKERQRKRRVSNTEINRGCWMLLKFNPNHLTWHEYHMWSLHVPHTAAPSRIRCTSLNLPPQVTSSGAARCVEKPWRRMFFRTLLGLTMQTSPGNLEISWNVHAEICTFGMLALEVNSAGSLVALLGWSEMLWVLLVDLPVSQKSQTIPSELARRQPTLRSFRWSCVVDMVCRSCFLGSTYTVKACRSTLVVLGVGTWSPQKTPRWLHGGCKDGGAKIPTAQLSCLKDSSNNSNSSRVSFRQRLPKSENAPLGKFVPPWDWRHFRNLKELFLRPRAGVHRRQDSPARKNRWACCLASECKLWTTPCFPREASQGKLITPLLPSFKKLRRTQGLRGPRQAVIDLQGAGDSAGLLSKLFSAGELHSLSRDVKDFND